MTVTVPGPRYRPAPRPTALGPEFYDVARPARFPKMQLRFRNQRWAERLGFGEFDEMSWLHAFGELCPLPDNLTEFLALRYHGHQFRAYNPELGDGRGALYAQLLDPVDGRLLDFGTKGSGTTRWSRGGDGRLTLRGGVREVLAAELLDALGVRTSKAFSLIETGEQLSRHDEPSPTRASVLVRLSHSHIRFGTFQRLYALNQRAELQRLVDYCTTQYYPAGLEVEAGDDPIVAFFRTVVRRTAELVGQWLVAGFVHGVLNTDNMSITGESFDYGPYRFLPRFDPGFVAAYFDQTGLYAFGRQPDAVLWNLQRLADSLTPLTTVQALTKALDDYAPAMITSFQLQFLWRLGLKSRGAEADDRLVQAALLVLADPRGSWDGFFFDWRGGAARHARALWGLDRAVYEGDAFDRFRKELEAFEPTPGALDHPYFQGDAPVSLVYDAGEAIWQAIAQRDDWQPFEATLARIGAAREAHRGGG
mgnify:CR=1 FL=1